MTDAANALPYKQQTEGIASTVTPPEQTYSVCSVQSGPTVWTAQNGKRARVHYKSVFVKANLNLESFPVQLLIPLQTQSTLVATGKHITAVGPEEAFNTGRLGQGKQIGLRYSRREHLTNVTQRVSRKGFTTSLSLLHGILTN